MNNIILRYFDCARLFSNSSYNWDTAITISYSLLHSSVRIYSLDFFISYVIQASRAACAMCGHVCHLAARPPS